MALESVPAEVVFDYSTGGKNIAVVAPLIGQSGWLACSQLSVNSLDVEEALILVGVADDFDLIKFSAPERLQDRLLLMFDQFHG